MTCLKPASQPSPARYRRHGFALPTILISSIVMLIILLVSVSSTAAVRTAIKNQYYTQLAQVAGEAGVAYAKACLAANGNVPLWSNAKPLMASTDCTGSSLGGTAQVLVVAGGGGGAAMTGGGGGAGGLIYDASHGISIQTYTVTVGAGGSGQIGTADPGYGLNGSNSVFDNLIAIGGGGGGTNSGNGNSGGSGGGGGHNNTTGGSATIGQGNYGSGGNTTAPNYGAGGGGGAGAVGGTPTNTVAGNGAIGLAYSISGSSVYYAGGGGGGTYMGGTLGVGGNGGGGSAPAGNAMPNTGGGGGGQINNLNNGGNGGSGIVIISYPTGTITASGGTITASGGRTIHTFTSSGTFAITVGASSCPSNPLCSVVTNGNIHSGFSIGMPTLDSGGKASTIPVNGYVQLLRTSDSAVWRHYDQNSVSNVNVTRGSLPAVIVTCSTGYIVVPGSATYGTSDFCVMKYEASNSGGTAVSAAGALPWVNISQTTSISTASSACTGCHLITEAEWLTIAQNVLSVASNWSSGVVGTGFIYSGHNDNSPANALVADSNDANGYSGETNTGGNQRRTLTLTNGEVIWDLAGNVWEWTAGTSTTGQPGVTGAGYAWREWPAVTNPGTLTPNPSPATTGISGASAWTSTQGIGQIYSNSDETALRGFLRGGHWSSGGVGGVLALFLGSAPSTPSSNIGFRVAR